MRLSPALLTSVALTAFGAHARAQTPPTAPPASVGEAALDQEDVDAIPLDVLKPEYPPPSARTNLIVAGASIFAGWYGGSVGASLLWDDAPGAKELRLPVVGPWLSLRHTGCAEGDSDCTTASAVVRAVLTIMSGVGQVGGLAAIGEGLFLTTARPARTGANPPRKFVRPAPFVAGKDAMGLSVVGSF